MAQRIDEHEAFAILVQTEHGGPGVTVTRMAAKPKQGCAPFAGGISLEEGRERRGALHLLARRLVGV